MALPVDGAGAVVPSPVVLTYSPYGVLGRDANRQRWAPKGYAVVFADVIGTGNSTGCFDYGGLREQESAYELVEWLAAQEWSTGRVAMVGRSYDGATANAAAVNQPPSLATIVSVAAVSRWYGLSYESGMRYSLNNESPTAEPIGTPLVFGSGLALPPPLDLESPDWAERVGASIAPCDEVAHAEHGYDDRPNYGEFWAQRDYLARADAVEIPVLVASNWGNGTVKPAEQWRWLDALVASDAGATDPPQRLLWMGSRWDGHVEPVGLAEVVDDWLDHHLKGVANGVDTLPRYVTQTADAAGPLGRDQVDELGVGDVTLYGQWTPMMGPGDYEWKLLAEPWDPSGPPPPGSSLPMGVNAPPGAGLGGAQASFLGSGTNAELHMNHHSRLNHEWFWFESPPLAHDVRVIGRPQIQIRAQTDREWVTFTPTIVDLDHACHVMVAGQHVGGDPRCHPENLYSTTRGFLDTRYRDGLASQSALAPNEPFTVQVEAQPVDYVFRQGHTIGLQITTEIIEWVLPKHYGCTSLECESIQLLWEEGLLRVVLPIVDPPADPTHLFDTAHQH